MANIENLNPQDVGNLEAHLLEAKKGNPTLKWNFYEQGKTEQQPKDEQPSNKVIFEKLEAIERKLNLIFGGNVLMNGRFVDVNRQ
jgi:hypothetical protein